MLRVSRSAELTVEQSVYRFEPASEMKLVVDVEFPELGSESAEFDGSRQMFLERIAPARTFGFARDAELLGAEGRAQHVDLRAVMVFDDQGRVMPPGSDRQPGELARHKLLDLLGDLYFYGGTPLGELYASRPGHAANHTMARRALKQGILAPR
jgi:UDP-3-O-[3-hydroxymyristoyl] N-acetylglucosamine deacetylase